MYVIIIFVVSSIIAVSNGHNRDTLEFFQAFKIKR